MKKIFLPVLVLLLLPAMFGCSSMQKLGATLSERDATMAIRQLLELGTKDGVNGMFTKETVMSAIFPEPLRKTLHTLQQLGLSNEINRFTTTLSTAAEKTATNSVPIFVDGIRHMQVTNAVQIVKNGGTAATDYLRSSVGDSLRHAITPVMQAALEEYKLNEQWDKIMQPAKAVAGNKLNLDLSNLMAGVVSETMFQKIAEKEKEVRSNAAARSTPLLRRVFSGNWQ